MRKDPSLIIVSSRDVLFDSDRSAIERRSPPHALRLVSAIFWREESGPLRTAANSGHDITAETTDEAASGVVRHLKQYLVERYRRADRGQNVP
jgi:hypothetical protein